MKGFVFPLLPVYKLLYAQASALAFEALPSAFEVTQAREKEQQGA